MLPELASRAIAAYSNPGDLVVDPLCGIGTTVVEAIHLGRHALGVELEPRWVALANANIAHAHQQGASGCAGALVGDARRLPRLLTRQARDFLNRHATDGVERLGCGVAELILTSPPYACEVGELDKRAWVPVVTSAPPATATTARTAATSVTPAAATTSRRWPRSTGRARPC